MLCTAQKTDSERRSRAFQTNVLTKQLLGLSKTPAMVLDLYCQIVIALALKSVHWKLARHCMHGSATSTLLDLDLGKIGYYYRGRSSHQLSLLLAAPF